LREKIIIFYFENVENTQRIPGYPYVNGTVKIYALTDRLIFMELNVFDHFIYIFSSCLFNLIKVKAE